MSIYRNFLAKIVNCFQPFSQKSFIIDARLGSKYTSKTTEIFKIKLRLTKSSRLLKCAAFLVFSETGKPYFSEYMKNGKKNVSFLRKLHFFKTFRTSFSINHSLAQWEREMCRMVFIYFANKSTCKLLKLLVIKEKILVDFFFSISFIFLCKILEEGLFENPWPKRFLCYPHSKFGVFNFLLSWIFRKKNKEITKKLLSVQFLLFLFCLPC